MNETEHKTPNAPEAENAQQHATCLQRQMTFLLVALFIVSGTLTVFMWRQVRLARADLAVLKAPAGQILQEFQQQKPKWDAFVSKVAEYGKAHPDFDPIMKKYKITLIGTNTPAPAQAIQPTQQAKPK